MFILVILGFGCIYALLIQLCIHFKIIIFLPKMLWIPLAITMGNIAQMPLENTFIACLIGSALACAINLTIAWRKIATEESS